MFLGVGILGALATCFKTGSPKLDTFDPRADPKATEIPQTLCCQTGPACRIHVFTSIFTCIYVYVLHLTSSV